MPLSWITKALTSAATFLLVGLIPQLALSTELRPPKPGPTALEKYVNHRHAQVRLEEEVRRFGNDNEGIRVIALVIRNTFVHPDEMRGVQFSLTQGGKQDQVYLPMHRVRTLTSELASLERSIDLRARYIPANERGGYHGVERCAPSRFSFRVHELCVAHYQRPDSSGLALSSGPAAFVHLPNIEVSEFAAAIHQATVVLTGFKIPEGF